MSIPCKGPILLHVIPVIILLIISSSDMSFADQGDIQNKISKIERDLAELILHDTDAEFKLLRLKLVLQDLESNEIQPDFQQQKAYNATTPTDLEAHRKQMSMLKTTVTSLIALTKSYKLSQQAISPQADDYEMPFVDRHRPKILIIIIIIVIVIIAVYFKKKPSRGFTQRDDDKFTGLRGNSPSRGKTFEQPPSPQRTTQGSSDDIRKSKKRLSWEVTDTDGTPSPTGFQNKPDTKPDKNRYNEGIDNRIQQLVESYNYDMENGSDNFMRRYNPLRLGVANMLERRKQPALDPIFQPMNDGHIYAVLISDLKYAILPASGIAIQDNYYREGALEKIFDLPGYDPRCVYKLFRLKSPAYFKSDSLRNNFTIQDKGWVELGQGA